MYISFRKFQFHAVLLLVSCVFRSYAGEVTTSSLPTQFCVPETLVRGGFENLVLSYNLIIPAEHQFRKGDVYVAARFKSKPNEFWLLAGTTWRKIVNNEVPLNSQQQGYDALSLLTPVVIFDDPKDVSWAVGDGEIWIGYGLRQLGERSSVSYEDMILNKRYKLIWRALTPPAIPRMGLTNSDAEICIKTSEVERNIPSAQIQ